MKRVYKTPLLKSKPIEKKIGLDDLSPDLANKLEYIRRPASGLEAPGDQSSVEFNGSEFYNDLQSYLVALNVGSASGAGRGVEYIESTDDYDWFRLPIENKLSNTTGSGGTAGHKYYMHLLIYDITLNPATQRIGIYDSRGGTMEFDYPSILPAGKPGLVNIFMPSEPGDSSQTTRKKVDPIYRPLEKATLTPYSVTLTTPSALENIVRDRSVVAGAATVTSGTTSIPSANIRDDWTQTQAGTIHHNYTVTHTEENFVDYVMSDNPLTHIQVVNGVVFNYSTYTMKTTIIRTIINEGV